MLNYKLLFVLLFCFFIVFNDSFAVEGNNIVGFLVTKKEKYENEISKEVPDTIKLLEGFGAKIVMIDYNELIKKQSDDLTLDRIIEVFINDNSITKVFIPGNYYNIDLPPYAPIKNRQLATESLVRLAKNKQIYLMGVCGGMQSILAAEGVKITNIDKIMKTMKKPENPVIDHIQGYPIDDPKSLVLNRIRINPLANLAKIVSNHGLEIDKNGWISIYLPHIHSEGIDNSDQDNIDKLLNLGYNVIGFADDGIMEIVEDSNGNIHFLSHPEVLLIYQDSISYKDDIQKKSILAMKSVISDFITKK